MILLTIFFVPHFKISLSLLFNATLYYNSSSFFEPGTFFLVIMFQIVIRVYSPPYCSKPLTNFQSYLSPDYQSEV